MQPANDRRNTTSALLLRTIAVVPLLTVTGSIVASLPTGGTTGPSHADDPHYTPAGFFDIHVCNWPDRNLFFMPLFSTSRYNEIRSVEIRRPDGNTLTNLDLGKFKVLRSENKPEKHVFLTQLDVPDDATDGWYTASITLVDGTQFVSRDYVIVSNLPRASNMRPPDGAEQIAMPEKLTWSSVGNGSYYQVFIRDVWDDSKLVYTSKLLHEPVIALPARLLQPDGLYSWQIHARDVNGDKLLGDFNKGSMSAIATFSTAEH